MECVVFLKQILLPAIIEKCLIQNYFFKKEFSETVNIVNWKELKLNYHCSR